MLETISFPVCSDSMSEYENPSDLQDFCHALGCDGIEAVWGGDDTIDSLKGGLALGYHLTFYPDWLDFWQGNDTALLRKFGSREAYTSFYGGSGREALLRVYRADLLRAVRLGAKYVVFHVSDVSIEEGYTYVWEHSHREVLNASVELINTLFAERDYPFALLVENQWWPGFTFTDPGETAHLLQGIGHPDKGIMLDTGHLMNTNTEIRTEYAGIMYIQNMLDIHAELGRYIRGLHLHQSLSGTYVQANTGRLPVERGGDYLSRFGESYGHITRIDRHRPWTDPAIAELVSRIAPEFLTHELSCKNREERARVVAIQREALKKGTLPLSGDR